MRISTKIRELEYVIKDTVSKLSSIQDQLESFRKMITNEEGQEVKDLDDLFKEREDDKEQIEQLESRLSDCHERLNGQGSKMGAIRYLVFGSGKNQVAHIKEIMEEFQKLAPDHPLLKGDRGILPSSYGWLERDSNNE